MTDSMPQQQDNSQGKQEYLSRRERRLLERTKGPSHGDGRRSLRRIALWGGALLLLGLIGWGMVKLSANTNLPTGDGTLVAPVTQTDQSMGPENAPVTLVEYSDFQCPACATFVAIVKQALAEEQLKDKVRFVYRSFPLTNIHPNAQLAAQAAQAAALQGKFWEMHDILFEKQSAWSRLSNKGARDVFIGYAKEFGLDEKKFASDIDSGAVKDRVREESDGAERSGVNSTPTFFVNGKQMAQPKSYEDFRQALINALNANP